MAHLKILTRYIIRESLGLLCMGAALFWPAGTLNWLPAWITLLLTAAWTAGTAVVILRQNPDLLTERLGPRKGAKRWDITIMSLLGLLQLTRYILAGFDHRNGWTGDFSWLIVLAAALLCAGVYALVVWSTFANAYFSQIVRLQSERGQVVVSGGPYHIVRHPAYFGAILTEIAIPFLLSSWPSLAISFVTIFLLILRTYLEDKTLQTELAGYSDYTQKVPYRLIPSLW